MTGSDSYVGATVAGGTKGTRGWAAAGVGVALAIASAFSPAATPPSLSNSTLDAALFYQLLVGEIELSAGRTGNAFGVILDAARRHNDPALYQRAIEIALQSRDGDQALAAARAWSSAQPEAIDALRYQTQILIAMNRIDDLATPLGTWLSAAKGAERPGLIATLPRLLHRTSDRKQALALLEKILAPYRAQKDTRTVSLVSIGRMALAAGEPARALQLADEAASADPSAPGPVLLALELLPGQAAAEKLVTDHLSRPGAEPIVRLGYAQVLTQSQRLGEAITQLETLTRDRPQLPEPWLTLGALHLELKHASQAEAALQRFLDTASREPARPAADHDDDAATPGAAARDLTPAWLLLSQAAEMRGDLVASEAWLAKVDSPQRALEVQGRRASLLARQGQVAQARKLIQAAPERTGEDARSKLLAEAQMLRDIKRWPEASEVLTTATQRFADDADLTYELAMVQEKLERFDEMERLLRRVIALKPDHPHAHNALGYSLADRNQRLGEARDLIRKALDMAPGDPFITDSLGWVEFRLGHHDEAIRLLRQAYQARPDTEIGAHLGEVLWSAGRHDEARKVWLEARGRDAANEVLRDTLARLKVGL